MIIEFYDPPRFSKGIAERLAALGLKAAPEWIEAVEGPKPRLLGVHLGIPEGQSPFLEIKRDHLVQECRGGCLDVEPIECQLVEAGVGPGHPKDRCTYCGKPLAPDEAVATCDANNYVTLCQKCYRAAGNRVR